MEDQSPSTLTGKLSKMGLLPESESSSSKSLSAMAAIKPQDIDRLVSHANEARDQAYAPHSHFYVGAALLAVDGSIEIGCNVENASYGLTLCAERTAAASAIAAGQRHWRAIAIASVGGVTPCGACRQFLAEFGTNLTVICVDVINGKRRQYSLAKLLPDAFDAKSLST